MIFIPQNSQRLVKLPRELPLQLRSTALSTFASANALGLPFEDGLPFSFGLFRPGGLD